MQERVIQEIEKDENLRTQWWLSAREFDPQRTSC